ncbi:hypothetical protein CON22_18105 [Bacillus cereus]|nr:hypothetical protein CON22_18105 [Bacillus cereus]
MKRNLVLFSMLMFIVSALVSVQMSPVFAAEEKVYQSNGNIGFYGQYEYPAPEKPDGSQPIETNPDGSQAIQTHPDHPHTLPQTGGQSNNFQLFEGITIMLFSIYLLIRAGKQSKEEILNEIS